MAPPPTPLPTLPPPTSITGQTAAPAAKPGLTALSMPAALKKGTDKIAFAPPRSMPLPATAKKDSSAAPAASVALAGATAEKKADSVESAGETTTESAPTSDPRVLAVATTAAAAAALATQIWSFL